jgi:hypothetical protein
MPGVPVTHRCTDSVYPELFTCGCGKRLASGRGMNMHGRVCDKATPEVRFWAKVDRSLGEKACWIWMGAITSHGYGCVNWHGRVMGAHKLAYQLSKGAVPPGLEIMHACDSRPCCNPAHLSVGTRQDNVDDKIAKGRHGVKPMREHRRLKPDDVREIRRQRGVVGSGVLAKKYGVQQSHIITIWTGRVWRSLT